MNKKISSFFVRNRGIIIVVFIHLLITIPLAYILNTWYDESCSLSTTSGSISYTVHRSIVFEWQPPVYYVLLDIWRGFNNSYFFARLLSIIFSCAAILISYKFIKKHLKVNKPSLVTLLIAINPFLIYYALEIRLYTMIIFFSGLLIFLMYEIYFDENKSKFYRVLFILISILAIHTQYYMGFLIFGIGVSVFIYKGWRKFKIYLIDMIFPLLSLIGVIPFLGAITTQTKFHEQILGTSLSGIIDFFRMRTVSYVLALDSSALRFFSRYEVLLFILLMVVIFLFSIKNRFKEFKRIIILKDYSTIPIIIVLILFFLLLLIKFGPATLEIRHTAALFLPLIYVVIFLVFLTQNKKFLLFWFLLFIFLYSTALVNKFSMPLAKEGDGIRISRYLESHEKQNELIFVPYDIIGMPLKVHYAGKNSIISLYDSLSTEVSRGGLLREIDNESGYCWWDFPYPDPTWDMILKQMKLCKKFIDENFNVIDKKHFKGMELWYLKRKK